MDLREWAIRRAAWTREPQIKDLLGRAGGNVTRALELCREPAYPPEWGIRETRGLHLAQWGYCGPDEPWIKAQKSAPDNPILVWAPGHTPVDQRQPDLVVTWREVFQYVAGQFQLALF